MTHVAQASTTVTPTFACVCMASALTLRRAWALCRRYKVRYLQMVTSPFFLAVYWGKIYRMVSMSSPAEVNFISITHILVSYQNKIKKINSASPLTLFLFFLCLLFIACESMADALYNTVWTLGCRPYMNSQRAACVCEGEERDEL